MNLTFPRVVVSGQLSSPTAIILFLPFLLINNHAQGAQVSTSTDCPSPCTTTIPFTTDLGVITGEPITLAGSGSFTVSVGANAKPTPDLNDPNLKFNYRLAAVSSDADIGNATFNYGAGDLASFSLNFQNVQSVSNISNALSLQTNVVHSGNPNYYGESFSATSGSAQTVNEFGFPTSAGGSTLNISQQSLNQAIVQGAVTAKTAGPVSSTGQNTGISAEFTPNFGLTIQQAASLMGFIGFAWTQTVTADPTMNAFPAGVGPLTQLVALKAPYPDPPPGGYFGNLLAGAYPFYNPGPIGDYLAEQNGNVQTIDYLGDQPADGCFSITGECFGVRQLSPTSAIAFTTDLVGVLPGDVAGPDLVEFKWTSNYSGSGNSNIGGIRAGTTFDDGEGTGGATLLSVTNLLEESGNISSIPEPSTWAMMLLGFTGLGFAGWRGSRRRTE